VSLPEHLVIDTSAVAALYKEEEDADLYWRYLNDGSGLMLPVASYLECVMVLSRYSESRQWLDALCAEYNITLFGSDARQANVAADAFARYGRGSNHRARLNFGDCLVYAAAKALDAPLLFKGDDFRATDIVAAL
jgi:ribonuclease VapC